MKKILVLLCVAMLVAVVACSPGEIQKVGANSSAPFVVNKTTETPPAQPPAETPPAEPNATVPNDEAVAPSENTPAVTANVTAPVVNTTPVVPADTTLKGCPLITPEKVEDLCKRDTLPDVSIVDGACVFTFDGNYTLTLTSHSATSADLDDWMAGFVASWETGELAERTARATVKDANYFAWYTGSRLITAASSGAMPCNGDNIGHLVAAVDTKASIGAEVDPLSTGVRVDAANKTIDNVALFKMMTMSYGMTGAIVSVEGNTTAVAKADFANGTFNLLVSLDKLADAPTGKHYESWLAKKGTTWDVIDTGRIDKIGGVYKNLYESGTDLRDHTFYVITLENDGAAGPTTRVMQGTLS
jgi:hypothetical protein